ncbi:MAG: nickel-dependent hydrogenase large subunit [Deltaproteobacteria bacterium]|nr:nickel-dependent hydrogenase large subunit [Deltaproteobacteria bacterium]
MLNVPLNRVEGDLEVRVEVDAGSVVDAWCTGTSFRGFENLLVGRGSLDGLVLTPRICGLCSTAHLTAAAVALDALGNIEVPANAVMGRNLALMAEHIQSDARQTFLMFAADLTSAVYRDRPLHAEAVRRYEPFRGTVVAEVLRETRKLLDIVVGFGGQWPHGSYMVPGGLTHVPSRSDIHMFRQRLGRFRAWFERRVLGCPIERWQAIRSAADLDAWLDENEAQRDGEVGFLVRFGRELGLDRIGAGHANFLSFGALPVPGRSRVHPRAGVDRFIPAGVVKGTASLPFRQEQVSEHVAHSWFHDYPGGRHPMDGETRPYATGEEGEKYSWAKAPRYGDLPAETGPLAEAILSRQPLFVDLHRTRGASVLTRQLARIVRAVELFPAMETWLDELDPDAESCRAVEDVPDGEAFGLIEAARGALGHWVKIASGRIQHYQVITPTAWNASPRDAAGVRGPIEEALIGTPVRDPTDPVELGHVVRSFDPCLVCTVHVLRRGRTVARRPAGGVP